MIRSRPGGTLAFSRAGDAVHYHVRTGKRDINAYDWQPYLDFAGRHFRGKR